jgi:hypothetical protein
MRRLPEQRGTKCFCLIDLSLCDWDVASLANVISESVKRQDDSTVGVMAHLEEHKANMARVGSETEETSSSDLYILSACYRLHIR